MLIFINTLVVYDLYTLLANEKLYISFKTSEIYELVLYLKSMKYNLNKETDSLLDWKNCKTVLKS